MTTQPMNEYFAGLYDQWRRTGKKIYQIWCTKVKLGTHVYNFLEKSNYVTDETSCIVLSGTLGEMWATTYENLAKTYHFATGNIMSLEWLEERVRTSVDGWVKIETNTDYLNSFAFRLDPKQYKNIAILTRNGEMLLANTSDDTKEGICDYLVCDMDMNGFPTFENMRVVDGRVFAATYSMKNFDILLHEQTLMLNKAPRPTQDLRGTKNIKKMFSNLTCISSNQNIPWRNISPASLTANSVEFLKKAKNNKCVLLKDKNTGTDYYLVLEDLSYVALTQFEPGLLICSDVCNMQTDFMHDSDYICYLTDMGIIEAGQNLPDNWQNIT